MLDLLLRGGLVHDGTGARARPLDVAVVGDRLQLYAPGEAPEARRVVEAEGLVVAPGFVDIHSHSDVALLELADLHDKVSQGITTELIGNCGISPYPLGNPDREETVREIEQAVYPGPWEAGWRDTAGFLARLEAVGTETNIGALVGHGTLRAIVMGMEARDPTADEMAELAALLAQALEQGAMGLSLGLLYPPGCYAGARELAALADVVARYEGVICCHMRNYLRELLPALREVIDMATTTGVRLEVSHLMALDGEQAAAALDLLYQARATGVRVTYDQYPYERGMTSAQTLLPPWMLAGGAGSVLRRLQSDEERRRAVRDIREGIPGWDNLALAVGWDNITLVEPLDHPFCGRPLSEVAHDEDTSPEDCLFQFLSETGAAGTMTMRLTSDVALETLMVDELGCFGTDGIPRMGNSHPRTFGTYPRVLGRYCRERAVIDLTEAVRRAAGEPASRLGLRRRGTIANGNYADIVVFDPDAVADRSSYAESKPPAGILHVIVNGTPVVENGRPTRARPGRILKREAN